MRHRIGRPASIRRATLAAVFAICLSQPLNAQPFFAEPDSSSIIVRSAPFGLARGQSLRVTGVNPAEPGAPAPDGRKYKMLVAVLIADGTVVAQSEELTVERGEFRSFDFDRDDLQLTGEPGTGRIQLYARVRYRFFALVDRTQLPTASLEIIDKSSGKTTAAHSQKPKEIVVVGSHIFRADFQSTGIVHGQTLRFSLLNPNDSARSGPIRARVILFDAMGRQLAQSPVTVIPPGEFRSFDFNRDDLPFAGEAGTGRLQSQGSCTLSVQDAASQYADFPASLEIVSSSSGASAGGYATIIRLSRNAESGR